MMGQITIDQSHQLMATLAVNTDWNTIDFGGLGLQDAIIRNPKEAGRQFTAFLQNGAKMGQRWREENGVIYFFVPSDEATGPAWAKRLSQEDVQIGGRAQEVLRSPDFTSTPVGVRIEVAVLKGELFTDKKRVAENIRAQAYAGTFTNGRKLIDPSPDLACIIRHMFSNKEIQAMGLTWIIPMHKPIKDSCGDLRLLGVICDDAKPWLGTDHGDPSSRWCRKNGFAFVLA